MANFKRSKPIKKYMRGGCSCRSLGALDEMKANRKEDVLEFELELVDNN